MERKFDEYKVLDTINQWINNCDTKTSIILATLGVFFSIVLSSEILRGILNIIRKCIINISFYSIIYLLFFAISIFLILIGLYKLVRVLLPTINLKHHSVMFFGNVARYKSFQEYYLEANNSTTKTLNCDLLHQIYAASKICNEKFQNQKLGLKLISVGLLLFLLWLSMGYVFFYICPHTL